MFKIIRAINIVSHTAENVCSPNTKNKIVQAKLKNSCKPKIKQHNDFLGCGAVELAIPYSDKLIRKYKTAHTIGKTTPGGESGGDARFAYSSIAFFVNISDKKATPNGIKNDKMSFFKFNVLKCFV